MSSSASSTSGNVLVTTTITGVILVVAFLIVHDVFRRIFKRNYEYRSLLNSYLDFVDYNGRRVWVPDRTPNKWPLSWIPATYSVEISDIATHVSLDAAVYLQFYKSSARLYLMIAILTCTTLIPAYMTGGYKDLDPDDPAYVDGILITTMTNVDPGSRSVLWLTFLMEVFVMATVYAWYYYDYVKFAWLARRKFARRTPENFAVLVSDIPDEMRSEEALYALFDRLYPGEVAKVYYYTERSYIDRMKIFYRKALEKKERAMYVCVHSAKKLKGQHPTQKIGGNKCKCGCKRKVPKDVVDRIEYWGEEQERLWTYIHEAQRNPAPEKSKDTGGAIVIFNSIHTASMAAQTQLWYRKSELGVMRAPQPAAVRWWKFKMPYRAKIPWSITTFFLNVLIIIAYSPISLFVSALSSIPSLVQIPGLEWLSFLLSWPQWILNLIQGLVPPLLLALFSVLISLLQRLIITRGRHFGQQEVEDRLRNYYTAFLFVAHFFYVLIGGSVFDQLSLFFQTGEFDWEQLASVIPAQSIFFMNYVLYNACFSFPYLFSGLVRLMQRWWIIYGLVVLPKTEREWRRVDGGMSSFFLYFKFYGLGMVVNLICIVYSTVAPVINLFAVLYFTLAFWVCKYQMCFTQYNAWSAEGYYFHGVFAFNVVSLFIKQFFMIFLFTLNGAAVQATLEAIFFVSSIAIFTVIRSRFGRISRYGSIASIFDSYGKTIGAEDYLPKRYLKAYIPPSLQRLPDPYDLSGLTAEEAEAHGLDLEFKNNVHDPQYGTRLTRDEHGCPLEKLERKLDDPEEDAGVLITDYTLDPASAPRSQPSSKTQSAVMAKIPSKIEDEK
ncbi:CSC1-like protein [Porphyridium purpureum]|uniref:CSC1-like protein n=1 Tax=Porphyridium purpureum TaxID=35688 RepID=A0A5J4YUR9_PORPP|nr:CSC1-like protein [Porphyridium purpureum]|eukprot:POR9357..scf209_3